MDENAPLQICDAISLLGHCIVMQANDKYYIREIPKGCYGDSSIINVI